jgi:signal transduction histidine kinase
MFSIKTRLIISYSLMFEIVLIAYSIFIHHTVRDAAITTLDTRLVSTAGRFEDELEEIFHDKQTIDFTDILHAKKQTPAQFSVRLWDMTGSLLYADTMLASVPAAFVADALRGTTRFDMIQIQSQEYRTAFLPISIRNVPYCIAQFTVPMTEIEESMSHLQTIFYISFPLAFVLSALAGYIIVYAGFRPMTRMIESAKNISEKNLEERLPTPGKNDEVKTLGMTFNRMIERIESAFQSQRQFIADASHEIRSPLTIISAELEFAQRSLADGDAKNSIRISLDEVGHLKHLTDDLLLLAKLDSQQLTLNRRYFRFDELAADCIRKVKQVAAAKGTTIQLQVEPGIEWYGDAEKISSVIIILLDNAIKYSFEKSAICVDLFLRDAKEIHLHVTNSGIGILPAELPLVFGRFFRSSATRNESSGNGLGLAIARRIIELHSGTIAVSSIPQDKTVFRVQLPAIQPALS